MDVGGIIGKISSNADKLGVAIGVYGTAVGMSPGDPFGHLYNTVQALLKTPHIPNIQHMLNSLLNSGVAEGKMFQQSIMGAIAGWLIEEIDVNPTITRVGSVIKKLSVGAAIGTAGLTLLEFCGQFNSRGESGSNSIFSNFSSAPSLAQYNY